MLGPPKKAVLLWDTRERVPDQDLSPDIGVGGLVG
jgi:hypothetical protein